MAKVENTKVQVSFKINRELNKVLEQKAKLEQMTKTNLCEIALEKELYKDVNIQNELLGSNQEIIKTINRLEKKFDVYTSMFIYFLKFFFTAHKEEFNREKIGDINTAFNIGEEKKNNFISLFKQENKHMTNIIEALLADYIIQEEK